MLGGGVNAARVFVTKVRELAAHLDWAAGAASAAAQLLLDREASLSDETHSGLTLTLMGGFPVV